MITSVQNSKVKRVRALMSDRRQRLVEKVFILEGVRVAEEAFLTQQMPETILFSNHLSARGREILAKFESRGVVVEEVEPRILKSLSDTDSSQGILLIQPLPTPIIPTDWDFALVLDRIGDPGNMGTILRTADAAGVQLVMVTPASTDPFAPKVVRSAMGAHLRLPLIQLDWPEIVTLTKTKNSCPAAIFVADSTGGKPCWQTDLRKPVALVIGSEAEGPQQAALDAADGLIHIPMPGNAESLNAAIAASILLFETVRQRQL